MLSLVIIISRGRKVLENRSVTDEDRICQLQKELEAAVLLGEETDRKFEEVLYFNQSLNQSKTTTCTK